MRNSRSMVTNANCQKAVKIQYAIVNPPLYPLPTAGQNRLAHPPNPANSPLQPHPWPAHFPRTYHIPITPPPPPRTLCLPPQV